MVLHWHGDRCRLPPEAELLASSLHCREQAFRLGARAVGLQFHIEVEPAMLERWLREDADYVVGALGPQGPQRLGEDSRRWGDRVARQGRILIANLFDVLSATAA